MAGHGDFGPKSGCRFGVFALFFQSGLLFSSDTSFGGHHLEIKEIKSDRLVKAMSGQSPVADLVCARCFSSWTLIGVAQIRMQTWCARGVSSRSAFIGVAKIRMLI